MKSKKRLNRAGIVIIITGGIRVGKSFVLQHFARLGFQTLSLDKVTSQILQENSKMQKMLRSEFPHCISPTGVVNKHLLAAVIFKDQDKLKFFNAAVYPIIRYKYEEIIENTRRSTNRSIVVEVPLMVEALVRDSYQYQNDALILVTLVS